MEEDKRNVMIFFAISMLIMIGYPYFFGNNKISEPITVRNSEDKARSPKVTPPADEITLIPQVEVKEISVESKSFSGKFSTRGVKLDNIYLKNFKKDLSGEEDVRILGNSENSGFAQTQWVSDNMGINLPDEESCWQTDSTCLSEDSPVILTWDNGAGLLFEKYISIDKDFLITIVDKVKNYGSNSVSLKSVATISRHMESTEDSMNFYEGPVGYINGKLEEVKYDDIVRQKKIQHQTRGGWVGITDKYWLTAFIPSQKLNYSIVFRHNADEDGKNTYSIDSVTDYIPIASSVEVSKTHHLFVGAKEIKVLDMYEERLGVEHFDLAIDFGCLYILTKPLLYALAYTKGIVGNMGLGIILLTLLIKLLLFPLANRSYRAMNRMSELQPKIQELRKKYEGDNIKLGQAISDIYKKEKINPLGGFLPILIQSPVLFALYKVLYISIEMRQAPFIGWIHDLSAADPLLVLNLFGLIPINLPGFLQIGIWPLIMGATMIWQQKMGPAPTDPSQSHMMMLMPVMFIFMFAQLPSGMVIYWTFSNILGIIQQHIIKRIDIKRREKMKAAKL
ncbi:MAG: membrane protein insertase YidC [Holosporaceae bacterium]|nr:membrane protein insertase YidC [Holosporaceae bacterium]